MYVEGLPDISRHVKSWDLISPNKANSLTGTLSHNPERSYAVAYGLTLRNSEPLFLLN